ncbi:DUF3813 family protein [Bacillus marinisedimentorum]|uniref:DUF3813 family protein n=1 Tax=Bacillus marinisedimentorum TaxID=1821260 RepID=UPI000872BA38|nr:DUF3813 family protein [Bacillus marinisedimentorum]
MENKRVQLAKAAVHRAETSSHAAITPEEFREARNKLTAAKNDVSSAIADSSNTERIWLKDMEKRLDDARMYIQQKGNKPKYF